MNVDVNLQDMLTNFEPIPIERKVKLDTVKNKLGSIVDSSSYQVGDKYIFEISAFNRILKDTTSATQAESFAAGDIVSEYETSVTKYKKMWDSIPTIVDYFELDTITNVDEAESAFYKASEKLGW